MNSGIFCFNCGQKHESQGKYCAYCGTDLEKKILDYKNKNLPIRYEYRQPKEEYQKPYQHSEPEHQKSYVAAEPIYKKQKTSSDDCGSGCCRISLGRVLTELCCALLCCAC